MPEGPEVRMTTDFLKNYIGKFLSGVGLKSGRYYKKKEIPGWLCYNRPSKLIDVDCKGKFIYFTFQEGDKEFYLFSTLGMSGMWSNKMTKHSRVSLSFLDKEDDDPNVDCQDLYFNDIRNFGTLKFETDKKELDKKLKSLGPDILANDVTLQDFINRFDDKPNKTIAECIMDQSVISGIGNYLKAEILYYAHISPNRLVKDISRLEWIALHFNSAVQIRRSYKLGGATIATYRQPNGEEGLYNRRFAVYNQDTDPLGNAVIKETTADKRTTHWVPTIQK